MLRRLLPLSSSNSTRCAFLEPHLLACLLPLICIESASGRAHHMCILISACSGFVICRKRVLGVNSCVHGNS